MKAFISKLKVGGGLVLPLLILMVGFMLSNHLEQIIWLYMSAVLAVGRLVQSSIQKRKNKQKAQSKKIEPILKSPTITAKPEEAPTLQEEITIKMIEPTVNIEPVAPITETVREVSQANSEDEEDVEQYNKLDIFVTLRFEAQEPHVREKICENFRNIQKWLKIYQREGDSALQNFTGNAMPLCQKIFPKYVIAQSQNLLITNMSEDRGVDIIHLMITHPMTIQHDQGVEQVMRHYTQGLMYDVITFLDKYIGAKHIKAKLYSSWDFTEMDERLAFYCAYNNDGFVMNKVHLGDLVIATPEARVA